jgi:hypothetical protein
MGFKELFSGFRQNQMLDTKHPACFQGMTIRLLTLLSKISTFPQWKETPIGAGQQSTSR